MYLVEYSSIWPYSYLPQIITSVHSVFYNEKERINLWTQPLILVFYCEHRGAALILGQ